ncbi:hypothetical protein N9006_01515, partial [bacterium]|nr:hypothetical protein [bacterium]
MSQELIFTSARKGLKLGSSGFCTVASTPGMPANLARVLEGLSGYRHLHAPGTPDSKFNPNVFSNVKVKVGGRSFNVLSRISDADLDYSRRSNKIAHHFAIDNSGSIQQGPSSLLKNESQFVGVWDQEPKHLDSRIPVGVFTPPRSCSTWKSVAGDAGWAGDVIEAVQKKKTVYLIVNPSTPTLELMDEMITLLPLQQQWDFTFSTFYTKTPGNVECSVRCVMQDSPEVATARRSQSNVVLDLTKHLGLSSSGLADQARNGQLIEKKKPVFSTNTPKNTVQSAPPPTIAPENNGLKPDLAPPALNSGSPEYSTFQAPPQLDSGSHLVPPTDELELVDNKRGFAFVAVVFAAFLLCVFVGLIGTAVVVFSGGDAVVENTSKLDDGEKKTGSDSKGKNGEEPAPEPKPEPAPEPKPEPAPEPALEPKPEPAPEPAPEPKPEPALETPKELLVKSIKGDIKEHKTI